MPGHDFKQLWQGDKVRYRFELRNPSEQAVRIDHLWVCCQCSRAQVSARALAPGSSVVLDLELEARSPGRFRKWVLVYSDAAGSPLRLWLDGLTRPVFAFEPPALDLDGVPAGRVTQRSVTILALRPGTDLVPIQPRASLPAVQARPPRRVGGVSGRWALQLQICPSRPREALIGSLTVRTGHPRVPVLALPFSGQAAGTRSIAAP